ncbi:MAG: Holliday junction resolvase RuvX, partial [Phycisphaeraceae bacterium]|nr:Holliday junction resolvase RuvX [Phycisphaeraceae bacterium]
MRYLAIDLGQKRTGLATGDDELEVVTPVGVIATASEGQRLQQLRQAIDDHGPDALVVGLPLNMDGSEGPAAESAREFARSLSEETGLPVHLADERRTSEAANAKMARSGLTHQGKKKRRDALAAAEILTRFLARPE